jgi:predicted esterase
MRRGPGSSKNMTRLRVQFIHGLESSPQGGKAQLLARHFETLTPAMDTSDFAACVSLQAEALTAFRPDVLVGSSFGGAVAVALLQRGLWRGATLLLAQAALRRDASASLPPAIPVWLVHGRHDEQIDIEDSRLLAATGSPDRVVLHEVDDDHALHATVASGRLVELVRALAESASRNASSRPSSAEASA